MADLIFKIDGAVFDLEQEGYEIDEILEALAEYLEISEELRHV